MRIKINRDIHARVSRRRSLVLATVFLLTAGWAAASGCSRVDVSGLTAQDQDLPEGVREIAPYRIDGDKVLVNNRICAMSGAPMREQDLGRFVSEVVYNGEDERFRGKTLVFNQCCRMCVDSFSTKWKHDQDAVLQFHGMAAQET